MAAEIVEDGGDGSRVAVIGSGAAGLTAAYLIAQRHHVTLFEAGPRPGGHVYTVSVDSGPDAGAAIDMGFIVYNERNYPNFCRLLERLDVASQVSDMSFAFHCADSGREYAGTGLNGLFSRRRDLLRPAHWRLLRGILAFGQRGQQALADGSADAMTLGEYLAATACPAAVVEDYVLPMGGAIWSSSRTEIARFPAATFLRFFDNHGLLALNDRPQWRTIRGGSMRYVESLQRSFTGEIRVNSPVRRVARSEDGVEITADTTTRFDQVVIATHADQALELLADADADERRLLGAWRYSRNAAVLHTDTSLLPPRRRAWASWNYRRESGGSDGPVAVTYHMNRLQSLATRADYLVSLNPARAPRDEHVVHEVEFTHPLYDRASVDSQRELPDLNGRRRTWFCGAYFRNGFHEDAVQSGAAVAGDFGVTL